MYGKKRITLTKKGTIVLAGNKSYIPIGKFHNTDGMIVGKLRNVESWDLKLDETNSVDFKFNNVSELRKFVKTIYAIKFV